MSVKEKLTSGKYYLTICGGLVFLYASITGILPPEAITGILMYIFMSYFKKDEGVNKNE